MLLSRAFEHNWVPGAAVLTNQSLKGQMLRELFYWGMLKLRIDRRIMKWTFDQPSTTFFIFAPFLFPYFIILLTFFFFFFQISTILIQSIVALPVILLAVIWFANWDINAEGVVIVLYVVIALFVAYPVIFFGIAMFPTCTKPNRSPNVLNKFAR